LSALQESVRQILAEGLPQGEARSPCGNPKRKTSPLSLEGDSRLTPGKAGHTARLGSKRETPGENAVSEQIINLWDESAQRLHAMEANLAVALRRLGITAQIQINSEPPLLARAGLSGKTPAIQVNDGDFWRHTIGEAISEHQFMSLLGRLRDTGVLN
jgi:hypothetical protein